MDETSPEDGLPEWVGFTKCNHPRQALSLDAVSDALVDGTQLRMLRVVDHFTRECVALHVAYFIPAVQVTRVLEAPIADRTCPESLTLENGNEFTNRDFDARAWTRDLTLDIIRPREPVENAYIGSFNGRLREECLNKNWFTPADDAR